MASSAERSRKRGERVSPEGAMCPGRAGSCRILRYKWSRGRRGRFSTGLDKGQVFSALGVSPASSQDAFTLTIRSRHVSSTFFRFRLETEVFVLIFHQHVFLEHSGPQPFRPSIHSYNKPRLFESIRVISTVHSEMVRMADDTFPLLWQYNCIIFRSLVGLRIE